MRSLSNNNNQFIVLRRPAVAGVARAPSRRAPPWPRSLSAHLDSLSNLI